MVSLQDSIAQSLTLLKDQGYQEWQSVEDEFKRYRGLYDKYAPTQPGGMPGSVSGFLTQFGLNLLSQSPTGNIFSTAATAAKDPYATFQGARSGEDERTKKIKPSYLRRCS